MRARIGCVAVWPPTDMPPCRNALTCSGRIISSDGQARAAPRDDLVGERGALLRRSVLQRPDQRGERGAAVARIAQGMPAEPDRLEIEDGRGRLADGSDDPVVEHHAALQVCGGDEERRGEPVTPEDRHRDLGVVGVAVIEGDRRGARRKRPRCHALARFLEREDVELARMSDICQSNAAASTSSGSSGSGARSARW